MMARNSELRHGFPIQAMLPLRAPLLVTFKKRKRLLSEEDAPCEQTRRNFDRLTIQNNRGSSGSEDGEISSVFELDSPMYR